MKKYKKQIAFMTMSLMLAVVVVIPFKAKAFSEDKTIQNIFVKKNEIVPYNYVVGASGYVDFQGEAQKDVVVFSGTVSINGPVHGDVIALGGDININGNVDGNVRALGGSVNINGNVEKNLTVAGGDVSIGKSANIGWDAMIASGNIIMDGNIKGNLNFAAGNMLLGGSVDGNIDAYTGKEGKFSLLPSAKIGGNLQYWSKNEISISPESVVSGKISRYDIVDKVIKRDGRFGLSFVLVLVYSILSSLVVSLIFVKLFNKQTLDIVDKMKAKPWISLGLGLALFILVPTACIVSIVFVITIPLVFIILFFYFLFIYLSKIFIAIIVGQKVFELIDTSNQNQEQKTETEEQDKNLIKTVSLNQTLIVGLLVYMLVINIPVIGMIISFVGLLWALGAVGVVVWEWIRVKN